MDNVIKLIVGASGAVVSYAFGGWSALLELLVILIVADYVTGIIASGLEGKLSSRVGYRGIPKKMLIFVMVFIGHKIDLIVGDSHFFRDATIFFYLCNELISIIENYSRMGLPVPEPIKKAIELFRGETK